MQDTELFLSLAEIAGVFVGFGALITIRSSGAIEAGELSGLRWVMSSAIWSVIVALSPIFVVRYGVDGHGLWLACSLLALGLFGIMFVVNGRAPENLEDVAATFASTPRTQIALTMGSTFWLPMAGLLIALALVVSGLIPDREEALYLTAVGLGLFMAALGLFVTVFWQHRPAQPREG